MAKKAKAARKTAKKRGGIRKLKRTHAAAFMAGVHSLLDRHGMAGKVQKLQLAGLQGGPCPDGQSWKLVCEPDEHGTMRCEYKCAP